MLAGGVIRHLPIPDHWRSIQSGFVLYTTALYSFFHNPLYNPFSSQIPLRHIERMSTTNSGYAASETSIRTSNPRVWPKNSSFSNPEYYLNHFLRVETPRSPIEICFRHPSQMQSRMHVLQLPSTIPDQGTLLTLLRIFKRVIFDCCLCIEASDTLPLCTTDMYEHIIQKVGKCDTANIG